MISINTTTQPDNSETTPMICKSYRNYNEWLSAELGCYGTINPEYYGTGTEVENGRSRKEYKVLIAQHYYQEQIVHKSASYVGVCQNGCPAINLINFPLEIVISRLTIPVHLHGKEGVNFSTIVSMRRKISENKRFYTISYIIEGELNSNYRALKIIGAANARAILESKRNREKCDELENELGTATGYTTDRGNKFMAAAYPNYSKASVNNPEHTDAAIAADLCGHRKSIPTDDSARFFAEENSEALELRVNTRKKYDPKDIAILGIHINWFRKDLYKASNKELEKYAEDNYGITGWNGRAITKRLKTVDMTPERQPGPKCKAPLNSGPEN